MIWLHYVLDLSSEMSGFIEGQRRATPAEVFYNFAMIAAYYAGISLYVIHAVDLARRGWHWCALKLAALGLVWWIFLRFGEVLLK